MQVSGGDYAFVSPWDSRVLVPSFISESGNFVTVYLTAKGDREALESGRFAVALASKFNATLKPKTSGRRKKSAGRPWRRWRGASD